MAMDNKQRYDSALPPSIKPASSPPWLSSALPRPPHSSSFCENDDAQWCGCEPGSSSCVHFSNGAFLQHVQSQPVVARGASAPAQSPASNNNYTVSHWLRSPVVEAAPDTADLLGSDVARDSIMALSISHQQPSHGSADVRRSPACGKGILDLHSDTANTSDYADADAVEQDNRIIWQNARLKADISTHPLYDQLLTAHVACLRIATPVDKLSGIDAQVAQASHVLARYYVLGQNYLLANDEKDELDRFMTHYVLLLRTFKEQLQQHVRDHAVDAVMACRELEQCLLNLTGESPGEGTGATMSDNDEQDDGEASIYDTGLDWHDTGGFGPLLPTESERSLMERLRQELKSELKTGYKERIVDVREEIIRKRRVGKLPGDTTSVLKSWWHSHAKWPYPTEDEKAGLVQETGLQLKQINNWFINQRKRNWHSNSSSSSAFKIKRKR